MLEPLPGRLAFSTATFTVQGTDIQNMNVLVVGGAGFIGRHLCAELVERDHEVTALSRNPDDEKLPDGVESARGDVTDYESIAGAFADRDAVVNLVALSPLLQSKGGSERQFEVHLGGTRNVVRAATEHGVDRLLQQSGLGASHDATTAHLRAKGQAETVVRESDLDWIITRPSVVFGDGDEIVPFTKLVTTPYVTGLPGGGKTPFQLIWVGDLVRMLADAIGQNRHVGKVYELGGPEVLTLADITRAIYRAEGRSVRIIPVPMPLTKVGMTFAEPIPFIPFGRDQYHGLQVENIPTHNDIDAFGVSRDDLTTFSAYLSS